MSFTTGAKADRAVMMSQLCVLSAGYCSSGAYYTEFLRRGSCCDVAKERKTSRCQA